MKTDQLQIKHKVEELLKIIKTRFLLEDGVLARNYPPRHRTIFDNFDDLVPFFIYFSEMDFLLSQVRLLRGRGESLLTLCKNANGVLLSRNLDEWVGGLYKLWKVTGDKEYYELLLESVKFIEDHLICGNWLPGAFHVNSNKTTQYYEPWSAGLLEVCCEMREEFPSLFSAAKGVMRSWLADEYFKKYSIFPFRIYRDPLQRFLQTYFISRVCPVRSYSEEPPELSDMGIKINFLQLLRVAKMRLSFVGSPGLYSQLMKSNSTVAFCLLEFYLADRDELWLKNLEKWCNSACKTFVDGGKVFMEVSPLTGMRRDPSVTSAFILADVLCDASWHIEVFRKYLPVVKEILDYQWATCLPNGLLPLKEGCGYAHLDNQVDFSVTLRRYSQLSGDLGYGDMSGTLMKKTIYEHYSPEGYLTFSGDTKDNVIDPKYNVLLLKGMINLLTLDQPLYPQFQDLFKDR
jgi:hypothetical protein